MSDQELKILNHLSQFVSDHKKQFIYKVLGHRTRYITIVLEDIYQSQNASAAVRTCECMGLQDIHIVENKAKYHFNIRVLKGSDKWMNFHRYQDPNFNNTETCFQSLKKNGYKILVADPAADGVSIDDISVGDQKIALLFGNELNGASEYALQHCDQKIKIPMFGFTESLNISVSVAICLNTLLSKLRNSTVPYFLSDEEKEMIQLDWYRKIVRGSEIIERNL